jgi:hypothetical protein
VIYPAGLVALYGVKPRAVVTFPDVNVKLPPNVKLPEVVTVPDSVNPDTVPVPVTDVTVPDDIVQVLFVDKSCVTPLIVICLVVGTNEA